ncbi:MAG: hypothetical protein ACUVT7_09390, partial [Thermoplasmata archaeon]
VEGASRNAMTLRSLQQAGRCCSYLFSILPIIGFIWATEKYSLLFELSYAAFGLVVTPILTSGYGRMRAEEDIQEISGKEHTSWKD